MSEDEKFHVHVGGNAQIDSTWLIAPKGLFAIPGGGMNGDENASATFLAISGWPLRSITTIVSTASFAVPMSTTSKP